jgi:RNA polymerase sigma factor FliA
MLKEREQGMGTSIAVDDLWTEFVATRRPELRDELIMKYAPLVRLVVGRLGIPSTSLLEAEDLVSYGIIGLINAIDRYDPARGVRFEAFASPRIRGAVIDQLRALNWLPRAAVSRVRQIESAMAVLEQQLGRPASEIEVATELGVAVGRYRQMLFEAGIVVLSLDTPLITLMQEDEFPTLGELLEDQSTPGTVEQLEMQEKLSLLASALDRLPERERLLLAMYYHEELTMKEISKVMGVSESRVCQLHMQAIMRLRSAFNVSGQDESGESKKVDDIAEGKGSLVHGRWHRRSNPARL